MDDIKEWVKVIEGKNRIVPCEGCTYYDPEAEYCIDQCIFTKGIATRIDCLEIKGGN